MTDIFAAASAEELLLLAVGVSASGLIAGVIAGMLGVGGGIILVPVLYQALNFLGVDHAVCMPLAVGTSLATIIPTSIRSALSHNKHAMLDWEVLRAWAIPTVFGVLVGTWIASLIGGKGMIAVFAAGAGLLGIYMLVSSEDWRIAESKPIGPIAWPLGLANGTLSVLMGIGGGTFGVAAMTMFGVSIHRAVATASGFGAVIAIPGTAGMIINGWHASGLPPYSFGYVSLIGFLLIVPATIVSTPWGVQIAHRLSRTTLRRVFGLFLCLTAFRMMIAFLN